MTNAELNLARFAKRRVGKMFQVSLVQRGIMFIRHRTLVMLEPVIPLISTLSLLSFGWVVRSFFNRGMLTLRHLRLRLQCA